MSPKDKITIDAEPDQNENKKNDQEVDVIEEGEKILKAPEQPPK